MEEDLNPASAPSRTTGDKQIALVAFPSPGFTSAISVQNRSRASSEVPYGSACRCSVWSSPDATSRIRVSKTNDRCLGLIFRSGPAEIHPAQSSNAPLREPESGPSRVPRGGDSNLNDLSDIRTFSLHFVLFTITLSRKSRDYSSKHFTYEAGEQSEDSDWAVHFPIIGYRPQ